jgi:hypothetical protein
VPAPLRARVCFGEERATIEQLARSRPAPARTVDRARIVWLSRYGDSVEEAGAPRCTPRGRWGRSSPPA